ncbi:hypothetical protein SDC9_103106 [bioreactor metagenome]|uniref:Uncharacterized protein n=1 Tax=bioreactor metagenome TaxID=1076179 RepID=A0A645B3L3_9ZZZZ
MSLKQIIGIANTLKDINSNFNIILVGTQQDRSVLLANQELPDNVFLPTFSDYNIFHSFELIKRSDFVITTDTSILHATVAFNKPLVGLYLGGEQQNEVAIWGPGPNSINHQIIFSGGPLIDVGEIEIDKIVKSLLDLQNSVK